MVHTILEHQPTLEDVRFLLAHASRVLPPTADAIDGAAVRAACVELRRQLAEERAAAMAVLVKALRGKYPDQEPADVERSAHAMGRLIRDNTKLRSLAADASTLFPDEFSTIDPVRVFQAFQAVLEEKS